MKKQKGFTLIELLIIVAIIVIMLGVVLSMSRDDRDKQALRASAEKFAVAIREAQNGALTGNLVNGQRPCSFTVESSPTSYSVSALTYDPSDVTGSCANPSTIKTSIDLILPTPFEIGVSLKSGPSSLLFRDQFAFLDFGGADFEQYVLKTANSSLEYTICVHLSGRVDTIGFGTPGPSC